MDINVTEYVNQGERVLSSECTLCQDCVTACAQGSLNLSMGLDFSQNKLPQYQQEKKKAQEPAA
jgi:Fe-S-cluster-containing hydrogenase component 2